MIRKDFRELLFKNFDLKQTILKNIFWLVLGQIINKSCKFLLIIYAARILGANQFGSFSFIFSLIALFFIFVDLGSSFVLIREYNQNNFDKRKLISTSFYLKLFLIGISFSLSLIYFPFIKDSLIKDIFIFMLFFFVIQSFFDFLTILARAIEKIEIESFGLIINGLITLFLGFLLLHFLPTVKNLILSYLISSLFALLVVVVFIIKFFPSIFLFKYYDKNILKRIFYLGWSFAGLIIISTILASADIIILGFFKNPETVGNYSVGVKIIQVLFLIGSIINIVLFPVISRLCTYKEQVSIIIKKSNSFVLMIIIPLIFGGVLIADKLIPAFFGTQYLQGILSFQILILTLFPFYLISILEHLLLAKNLQTKVFKYNCLILFLNVILNLILIPKFSLYGAALTMVISYVFKFILILYLTKKNYQYSFFEFQSIIKYFIASILMSIFIFVILFLKISIWITIPLAILIYFFLLYILREARFFELLYLFKPIYK